MARLTEAELEEGRRLRATAISTPGITVETRDEPTAEFLKWLFSHCDALLADPEEIAREAVREFAEALFSNRVEVEDGRCSVIYEWRLVKEARARGVTLDEKP